MDRLTISRCIPNSSLSDPLPPDILTDITMSLPVKSIGKFRCVSKVWALILSHPQFDEMFMTKSVTRPRFLFVSLVNGELSFFTSPQRQNPNRYRSLVATRYHKSLRPEGSFQISRPIRGWFSIEDKTTFSIFNPMTGQSLTLPILKPKMLHVKRLFGYDPIHKEFKVLCTTWSHEQYLIKAEHYVVTLGTKEMVWRKTESHEHLRPLLVSDSGICINGVLYYMAFRNSYEKDAVIASFDFSFEKLSFVYKPKGVGEIGTDSIRMVNYMGQLGILQSSVENRCRTRIFYLWVLKDTKWTKHIYKTSNSLWRVNGPISRIVGMIGNEIVLSSTSGPLFLGYYNLEKDIVRTVKIRGFEVFKDSSLVEHCFLDYLEDVKLL